MAKQSRRLLTAKEVAEILGVHPQTVWNLAYRGELRSVKVAKLRKFDVADVEDYIEAGKGRDKLPPGSPKRKASRLLDV
jgi:excisionase family DNA binding protein